MPILDSNLNWGPTHANSNVICVIDIRVGGTEPSESDLLEICILPLNHSYKPHQTFPMFNLRIKPAYPVDLKIARVGKTELLGEYYKCFDCVHVADLFDHWIKRLELKEHKKILPLAFNWINKQKWIKHWLGPSSYDHYFAESYRDPLAVMNFINDRTDYRGDGKIIFTAPTLDKLISNLAMARFDTNSLPANCLGISEAYRKLLHHH